jgi:hypothetical protein
MDELTEEYLKDTKSCSDNENEDEDVVENPRRPSTTLAREC